MQPMTCSNCGEPLEEGAAFCGNCGHPIAAAPGSTKSGSPILRAWKNRNNSEADPVDMSGKMAVAAASGGLPAYAVPIPAKQSNEVKARMAPVLGLAGIVAGLFIPLAGIAIGVVGLVMASSAHRAVRRRVTLIGVILTSLAILVGLWSWAYAISKDQRLHHPPTTGVVKPSGNAITANNLITPCYSVTFVNKLNIENNSGSCNMDAYNGGTLDQSSNAYKVYATDSAIDPSSFNSLAKQAIEKDIASTLPGFSITRESAGQFAGSQAYFVAAGNGTGVSIMEAAAYHATANGDNFFVFVHAENSNTIDLNEMQAGWHWE